MNHDLEMGSAIGLVSLGIFKVHDTYVKHAGSLDDARTTHSADAGMSAKLRDADYLTGGIAVTVGVAVSIATGKSWPICLSVLGFLIVSLYYHATFLSPGTSTPIGATNDDSSE